MTEIMLLGDTHGNTNFVVNVVIPAAKARGVKWIYQVGDFGYWEHTDSGVLYLDAVSKALLDAKIELVFIQGNHDKVSLIEQKYSQILGFYSVRPGLWFAPNGTQWEYEGKSFVAFGGAYSVDKQYRLENEARQATYMAEQSAKFNREYPRSYFETQAKSRTAGSQWFPEEEMTDSEMDAYLYELKGTEIDVMLAHDKPLSSNPGISLLPINECIPNQRRLQNAVNTLQPKLFVHGHLHVRYTDSIRCGNEGMYTEVQGLGADVPNFNQSESSWEPTDAWEFLTFGE